MKKLVGCIAITAILLMILPSCKSIGINRQPGGDSKVYFLGKSEDKSTYLYVKSYTLENDDKIEPLGKATLTNEFDDVIINLQPYQAIIPIGDSVAVTEFAVFSKYDNSKGAINAFYDNTGKSIDIVDKKALGDEALFLVPTFLGSGKKYQFGLYAIRINESETKLYFPSSERLRVQILSHKDAVLWSSNYMMNYLAVIGELGAKSVGEIAFFTTEWNGKTNSGEKFEPTMANVLYILPIQPKNYIISKLMKPE